MDIESKIWNYSSTGTKIHAFVEDVALCRSNIRRQDAERTALDYSWAKGAGLCPGCNKKFNAAIERMEASMQPSTGEGDYLPPADEAICCDHAPMYHGGRGCDLCNCKTSRNQMKETTMTIKDGPLTERQRDIIERVMQGKRHREITQSSGIPVHIIKHEMSNIIPKLGATTSAQAVATYATALAYRNAAAQVLSARVPNPSHETETHVNHVLEGIAHLFQDWAAQRLPK